MFKMLHLVEKLSKLLIVLAVTPVFLLICSPIYLFRCVIKSLKIIFRPDLGEILDYQGILFGVNSIFSEIESTSTTSIVLTCTLEGKYPKALLIERVKRYLEVRRNNGKLKYINLTQFLTTWMGFMFWTPDQEFKIENHVKNLYFDRSGKIQETAITDANGTEIETKINQKDLNSIKKQVLNLPFPVNRSQWEFYILSGVNYKPKDAQPGLDYSVVIFKIHHVLADGYSLGKLILSDNDDTDILKSFKAPKLNFFAKFLIDLYTSIRAPFDLIHMILFTQSDVNAWHLDENKLCGNENFHLVKSENISLDFMKTLKNRHGSNFLALVISAITSAVRESMSRNKVEVPENMTAMCPFPSFDYPDKFGNFWSAAPVTFPVGIGNRKKRLEAIQNELNSLKNPMTAITLFKMQPLIGCLFYWMVKPVSKILHITAGFSDLRGPSRHAFLDGYKVIDCDFIVGFPPGKLGIMFLSNSYGGQWSINILVDHGILNSDKKAEELLNLIVKEIHSL